MLDYVNVVVFLVFFVVFFLLFVLLMVVVLFYEFTVNLNFIVIIIMVNDRKK